MSKPDLRQIYQEPEQPAHIRGATSEIEAINKAAEVATQAVQRAESLATKLGRAEASLELATMKIAKIEHELQKLTIERDHFMSRCAENSQLINNIAVMITEAVRTAQDGTYGRTQAQRPGQVKLMEAFERDLESAMPEFLQQGPVR